MIALSLFGFVLMIFLGLLSHEEMRPYFTTVMKEYQYERLNPNTYHQKAGQTAIALGQLTGSGFCKSEFTGHNWLPFGYTDSVFPAFTEEFGLIGAYLMIALFFGLIYFSFHVTTVANDHFGRLLSAGISVYLAMHVIINMGMMCGFLPITGVATYYCYLWGIICYVNNDRTGFVTKYICKKVYFFMMITMFGQNEWIGEGKLEISALDRPSILWIKFKSFVSGEVGVEIKSDVIGELIQSVYIPDIKRPNIVRLNSSLIGAMEGEVVIDNNFLGIEYGNEVLGYAGFESYHFDDAESFSYEAKFINQEEETFDMEAKCVKYSKTNV